MNGLTEFYFYHSYLMLALGNLGIVVFLVFFSKAAQKISPLWFLISVTLGGSVMIFTALTLAHAKSSFLNSIEIGLVFVLFIALILGSKFGSTIECIGIVVDNNLKIGYPTLFKEARAIKVICEKNTLKTRFVSLKNSDADLEVVIATDNQGFLVGEKIKFKAVVREGIAFPMWPMPGPVYLETRTWGGYVKQLTSSY